MLMLATTLTLLVSSVLREMRRPEIVPLPPAENALSMQCEERHGLASFARGPYGVWVSCYVGDKRLWHVKL